MMGAERRSMVMSEKEKLNTAYHEAGHAIVGRLMPEHDPVYKVSIIPRGRALGVTMFLPEEDRYSHSRRHIISQITSLFGGRVAEEMTLGKDGITTGASNDIQRATEIARNMVTKWGLSDTMGPLMYDEGGEEVFLGRTAAQPSKAMSDETALAIDKEVRSIIDDCYEKARQLLEEHRPKMDMMAEALMQYETIDSEQIDSIMDGKSRIHRRIGPAALRMIHQILSHQLVMTRWVTPSQSIDCRGDHASLWPARVIAGDSSDHGRPQCDARFFSDGGTLYRSDRLDPDLLLARAEQMMADGAAILDIGGESTPTRSGTRHSR